MAFIEDPIFPGCPKFGYTSTILYSVDIVETASGEEFRNINWAEHRRSVQVTVGPSAGQDDEDVENLMEFYHLAHGTAHGFRVLDAADWKSCKTFGTPAMVDQPLVLISGNEHQLTKRYGDGATASYKSIYKPFGTILIARNGVSEAASIDMTTGIVTIAPGGTLTWGGQYHIPCRFDSDFPVEILAKSASRSFKAATFTLKELRYEAD